MIRKADVILHSEQTCYVLGLAPADVARVVTRPLPLGCGESLAPGEGFTQIGTPGYAANPNISMADGWVQYFVGLVEVEGHGSPTTLAVFKAHHPTHGSAFESREKSAKYGGRVWFLAYSWAEDLQEFGFWSPAQSLRWINTDVIVRA